MTTGRKVIFIVFLIGLSGMTSSKSAELPASDANASDIRTLLQANGTADIGRFIGGSIAQQLIDALHHQYPALGVQADSLVREVTVDYVQQAAEKDQLADRFIPVYAKNFTSKEIRQLTAFYHSAVGRKLALSTPILSAQAATVTQEWMVTVLPGLQATVLGRLRSHKLIE